MFIDLPYRCVVVNFTKHVPSVPTTTATKGHIATVTMATYGEEGEVHVVTEHMDQLMVDVIPVLMGELNHDEDERSEMGDGGGQKLAGDVTAGEGESLRFDSVTGETMISPRRRNGGRSPRHPSPRKHTSKSPEKSPAKSSRRKHSDGSIQRRARRQSSFEKRRKRRASLPDDLMDAPRHHDMRRVSWVDPSTGLDMSSEAGKEAEENKESFKVPTISVPLSPSSPLRNVKFSKYDPSSEETKAKEDDDGNDGDDGKSKRTGDEENEPKEPAKPTRNPGMLANRFGGGAAASPPEEPKVKPKPKIGVKDGTKDGKIDEVGAKGPVKGTGFWNQLEENVENLQNDLSQTSGELKRLKSTAESVKEDMEEFKEKTNQKYHGDDNSKARQLLQSSSGSISGGSDKSQPGKPARSPGSLANRFSGSAAG